MVIVQYKGYQTLLCRSKVTDAPQVGHPRIFMPFQRIEMLKDIIIKTVTLVNARSNSWSNGQLITAERRSKITERNHQCQHKDN